MTSPTVAKHTTPMRLYTRFDGDAAERPREDRERQDSERELLVVVRVVVECEEAGEVRRAGGARYGRNCSSCHDGTGASSSSGRPPPPGCW